AEGEAGGPQGGASAARALGRPGRPTAFRPAVKYPERPPLCRRGTPYTVVIAHDDLSALRPLAPRRAVRRPHRVGGARVPMDRGAGPRGAGSPAGRHGGRLRPI